MNEIFTRRSIRKYENKPVPDEMIRQLLKAAMYAPSAKNEQPWHFVVVQDREILDELAQCHPFAQMMKQAPVAIVPCCDTGIVRFRGVFWIQDMAAAIENILLEATHLGLGSCWCGVYPRENLVEKIGPLLQLPVDVIPVALIAIGYAGEKVEAPDRFIPERIHFNRW